MEVYRQSNYYWYDSPTHSCGIPLVETQPCDAGPPACYAQFLAELNADRIDSYSPEVVHLSKRFKKDVDIDRSTDSLENFLNSPSSSSKSKEGCTTPKRNRRLTAPRNLMRSPSPSKAPTKLNDSLDEEDFDMAVASQAIEEAIKTQRIQQTQVKPPARALPKLTCSVVKKKPSQAAKPQIPIVIQRTQSYQKTQIVRQEEIIHHQKPEKKYIYQSKPNSASSTVSSGAMPPPSRVPPARPQPSIVIQPRPSQITIPLRPMTRLQARNSGQGLNKQPQTWPQQNQSVNRQTTSNQAQKRPFVQGKTISVVPRFTQNPVRKTNSLDPPQSKPVQKKTPLRTTTPAERTKSMEVEDDFYDDSWIQGIEIPQFK